MNIFNLSLAQLTVYSSRSTISLLSSIRALAPITNVKRLITSVKRPSQTPSFNTITGCATVKSNLGGLMIKCGASVLLAAPLPAFAASSVAVTPSDDYVSGMTIQGQRLNLYSDCEEGAVSCDKMRLLAPDLRQWAFIPPQKRKRAAEPYPVLTYPAKTRQRLCTDQVTPCQFLGYSFVGEDIEGIIDPIAQKITLIDTSAKANSAKPLTLPYQPARHYWPLTGNAAHIDQAYTASDIQLNDSYQATKKELAQLYGYESARELKRDQSDWIIRRSNVCGADPQHRPRTQSEKICFMAQNEARTKNYYLWID